MNKPDLNYNWYVQDQNIYAAIARVLKVVKNNWNRLLSFKFF